MGDVLIKNGRVIDPANSVDGVMDVLVSKGKIAKVAKKINASASNVIDAKGKWVTPGLIDIHVHLREPGFEYKETIETGSQSAAAGGFTSIACMANTYPVNDNASVTERIIDIARQQAVVNVYVIGAVTKGLDGKELADIGEMAEKGIVALSDDGKCVMDAGLMRSAMEYASMFNLPIIEHAEDCNLARNGVMNEGAVSSALGLAGQPKATEDAIVARDIALAEYLGAHIHIAHVSSANSVTLIREAKKRGVNITAEVTPHHFTITDETCLGYNTNAKMAPPLREQADMAKLRAGLKNGSIDCIATDHAPHDVSEKEVEFDHAAFGIVGLETAIPLSLALVRDGVLTPLKLIETMTVNPAKIIGIDRGTLSAGAVADVTIIDPDSEWTVDPAKFKTKGKNTPFAGMRVQGKVNMTMVKGKVVYEEKS
ncbi:Dihydroorotase [hydrothermal vent metagenome]|uniref:Dihydroorotase n=1 Tax=hydrothermal vent metagenome TaxID=652676 RepID=A0A3B1BU00_9ZZZZ